MPSFDHRIISQPNPEATDLISNWYLQEWKIPVETTIKNQQSLSQRDKQFQTLMRKKGVPIGTGGIYNHVGLIDREPRFGEHKHWLALMYIIPEVRGQGYGYLLCEHIQQYARELGIKELYLFTPTAESLYKRLGWEKVEQLSTGGKDIVVMKLGLI